jgi:cell wall-associated NlpC family hydrolase
MFLKESEMNEKIQSAINYAWSFLGTPYRWGGENPMEGYDCSGFVQEILRSVDLDPRGDQTAQTLYNTMKGRKGDILEPGSVVFYGKWDQITHVAFAINRSQIIEAGGGGRAVKSIEDAKRYGAFVRIRPYDYRNDLVDIIYPSYD